MVESDLEGCGPSQPLLYKDGTVFAAPTGRRPPEDRLETIMEFKINRTALSDFLFDLRMMGVSAPASPALLISDF